MAHSNRRDQEQRCGMDRITVEPIMFLFFLGTSLQLFTIQNMVLHRVCTNHFNYSEEMCKNISTNSSLKTEVQRESTQYLAYNSILESLPAVFLSIIVGPWSDKHGRKIPILYSLLLATLSASFLALFSYENDWPVSYILIGSFVRGLSGNIPMITMAAFSYISEITEEANRTFRLGVLEGNMFIGLSLGLFSSGTLLNLTGHVAIFAWATGCMAAALLYTAVRLRRVKTESSSTDNESKRICSQVGKTWLDMWKKPRRWKLYMGLLLLASVGSSICTSGEVNVFYLYMQKKFDWTFEAFTEFATGALIARAIGVTAVLGAMVSCCQLTDSTVGAFGALLFMCALLVIALAKESYALAISVVMLQAGNASTAIIRTLVSKLVAKHEVGQIFSVFTSTEAAVPLMSVPFFMLVYRWTLDSFPGLVFMIMAGFQFLQVIMFIWFYKEMKQQNQFRFHVLEESSTLLESDS